MAAGAPSDTPSCPTVRLPPTATVSRLHKRSSKWDDRDDDDSRQEKTVEHLRYIRLSQLNADSSKVKQTAEDNSCLIAVHLGRFTKQSWDEFNDEIKQAENEYLDGVASLRDVRLSPMPMDGSRTDEHDRMVTLIRGFKPIAVFRYRRCHCDL